MQRAARQVSDENHRLRALLGHHGITEDEIDRYLSAPQSVPTVSPKPPATQAVKGAPRSLTTYHHSVSPQPSLSPAASPSNTRPRSKPNNIALLQPASASASPSTRSYVNDGAVEGQAQHSTEPLQGQSPRHHVPKPPQPVTNYTDTLQTSCEAAAAILVDLHGKDDLDATRAALGCVGASSCSVKNTTIFELMDEIN